MRIFRLESRVDGEILATIVMASGEESQVTFTTDRRNRISLASPDQPIFDREYLDAADIRAIVSAILAFDSVALHSQDLKPS